MREHSCTGAGLSPNRSLRQRWFRIPGDSLHELDFRLGGREISRGTFAPSGVPELVEYRSQFLDIVADERIVYVYELLLDGRRRSISLVTVDLSPQDAGTRLKYTEQFAFVAYTGDGRDDRGEREGGTRLRLNALASVVEETHRRY
ncbi:MAG TPA: SRPBCC domain-containing protein [Chloroflexota bacterium]